MKVKFGKVLVTIGVSTVLMAGCSGGGDESPSREAISRTADASEAPAIERHEPRYEHCHDPVTLNAEMLEAVNELRSSTQVCRGNSYPPAAPLTLDARLENAAIVHADDMATHEFLSHTGSDGSSSGNRADRQDYDWFYISENLAGDSSSLQSIVAAWMNSNAGHCEVIMAARAEDLGAACIYREDSQYRYHWTLELGAE